MDRGPWKAEGDAALVWVQSEDFEHDVRLYVNGDFGKREDLMRYAKWVAEVMNAASAQVRGPAA